MSSISINYALKLNNKQMKYSIILLLITLIGSIILSCHLEVKIQKIQIQKEEAIRKSNKKLDSLKIRLDFCKGISHQN